MRVVLLIGMAVVTVLSYVVSGAVGFYEPELARLVFFHLPCAFACPLFLIWAFYTAFKYIKTKDRIWDERSATATEIATILAVVTMLSGIIFSKVQWTKWWNWDPRQTSFLIVLLIFAAYFGVRAAFDEPAARAKASSAFQAIALLPTLFLIFVFPRLPQVVSLHPNETVTQGKFSSDYMSLVLAIFAFVMWTCCLVYKFAVRTAALEIKLDEYDVAVGGDTTPSAVVRTVATPHQD
jgi:heme exporter protein C